MRNNKYTFWQLLSEKRIVIPIIQRDYAQGREGKEYVRKNFLEQLGKAVFNEEKTELDFVYGTESKVTDTIEMFPLDGQQRLTTLWLLHWYVAYKAKELPNVKHVLKRFSYETRTSSREFCEMLCELEYEDTDDIVVLIKQQTWFFSSWQQDPTIKAMLVMLSGTDNSEINKGEDFVDGIEELFDRKENVDFKNCWDKLTSNECPIHFNFLPLQSHELPVSDDLYIKMNARGKALTSFENFKAELVDWIYKDKHKEFWGANEDEQNESRALLVSAIDNKWTDIFWKNKTEDGKIDEIFFAFLNRYFLNELIVLKEENKDKEYLFTVSFLQNGSKDEMPTEFDYLYGTYYEENRKTNNDNKIVYNSFSVYGSLLDKNPTILKNLQKLFKNLDNTINEKIGNTINAVIAHCTLRKDNNIDFIPTYKYKQSQDSQDFQIEWIENFSKEKVRKISEITQAQRVVLYAVCRYLIDNAKFNETEFKKWLRVVWNIVENSNESSTISGFASTLRLIDRIANHIADCIKSWDDIYESLSSYEDSTVDQQLKEEIDKARQILCPQEESTLPQQPSDWEEGKEWNWESAIMQAENYTFFRGAIRFLFKDENGKTCWNDFGQKWENAKKYFDEDGINSKYNENAILLRSFVMAFNCWGHFWGFHYDGKKEHWRKILTDSIHVYPISILLRNGVDEDKLSKFQSEIKDLNEYQKSIHSEMVNTRLLSNICEGCKLSWQPYWAQSYALYPDYCRNERNFYIFSKRNEILNEILKDSRFSCEQRIFDTNFFWGKDVWFKIKIEDVTYTFRWQASNWVDMYEGDEKLYDKGGEYEKLRTRFGGNCNDSEWLVEELKRCIIKYVELTKT